MGGAQRVEDSRVRRRTRALKPHGTGRNGGESEQECSERMERVAAFDAARGRLNRAREPAGKEAEV